MDSAEFDKMRGLVERNKLEKEEKIKEDSKNKLRALIEKKFKTTFIGALSQFEEVFGYLWGHHAQNSELSDNQLKFKKLYERVRNNVLNNGNTQLRALLNELDQYSLEWQPYQFNLKVK